MKQKIYRISTSEKYGKKTTLFDHFVYEIENKTIIVPIKFRKENINPENFLKLKQKLNIESVLIYDRTIPFCKNACIVDHINGSGFNFFIGSKSINGFPMFPDMSKIYNPIKDLKKITVHTVGPKRFKNKPISNQITSESIGLLSPIWHYVGVLVSGKSV